MSYTFQGYRRPDGKFGARNLVAVIPTTICANDVAQAICRQIQGTIGYFHHQGCCQLPSDLKRVTEVLIDLGLSANVGAALIVSLGCEGTDHQRVYETIKASGKPCEIIHIQELGGTSAGIQAGMDAAQRLVMQISGQQRETCDISNLTMAIKCGGSDTTSGMASNCVIGYVADKLVDLGDVYKRQPSSAPNGPQPGRRSGTSRQSAPGSSDGCCVERSFSEKKPSSPARYRTSVLPRHGRSALSVPIRREAPPANSAAQIVCSCMPRSFASVTRPLFVSRDSRK